jgi:hypothetical protein
MEQGPSWEANCLQLVKNMKTNIHLISRSLLLTWNEKCSGQKRTENENIHFMFNNLFFENHSICETCGKILQSWTGHRWKYGAYALNAGYQRLQTQLRICNNYYFVRLQWFHERASMLHFTYTACLVALKRSGNRDWPLQSEYTNEFGICNSILFNRHGLKVRSEESQRSTQWASRV